MSQLEIRGVRSYCKDSSVFIDLSKKINLIYGQNGSGKSTISGYFYKPTETAYNHCRLIGQDDYRYIVYNSQFIEDSFYNESEQPGIFTLSQENKDIMEAINDNEAKLIKLKKLLAQKDVVLEKKDEMILKVIESCQSNIWNKASHIRKKDGGLGELMAGYLQKSSFFHKINDQIDMEELNTDEIINEYNILKTNRNTKYSLLEVPSPPFISEAELELLSVSLLPSGNSYLSLLIEEMGNSDWVRAGLNYTHEKKCPFCQEDTINESFKDEIKNIFDDTYNEKSTALKILLSRFNKECDDFVDNVKSTIASNSFITDKLEINELLDQVCLYFNANLGLIKEKVEKPSLSINAIVESSSINLLLEKVERYNSEIKQINMKVDSYDTSIAEIKERLWKSLRYQCNDLILTKDEQLTELYSEKEGEINNKNKIYKEITSLNENISTLRRQVSNIDETIKKINRTLSSLGISHFKIKKSEEKNFFQICRESGSTGDIYKTLSEGEKTLITFLYFLELCNGRLDNANENNNEKLIVIDDPISSLSHDYIYEVASLIHHRIIKNSDAAKLVVLTHNLFFFQELIKLAPLKTDAFIKKYQLHRVIKDKYSNVLKIERDAIKNEYEALWMVLKDVKKGLISSVILPNVMRNILEYYFSFSCKMERLSEELDKLVDTEIDMNYKTFYRYINRGSHSDSINISNLGQISSKKYLEMFEEIFKKTNDDQHFNKMLGVNEEEVV
ncbi:AAA family ATPase [[Curtobacterium] plantarum]|uniref:AAA family ATPase n=1 Tax=[Curtobacterium] plantarum TaxID=221276 RepID=UPI000F08BCC3|nr:AAA family ATPase [[Curtobacterium] plantarum]RNA75411.1 hypothetical protein EBO33_16625 [[Curtobacterium] plantarum]